MPRKAIKPKMSSLGCSSYQVIYKCGKCGYGFNMAHDGFDYCPHCGSKIDWGVVWHVNEEWRSEYICADYNRRQELNAEIDIVNETITDGEKKRMKFTLATKQAITKSNIQYYLSQGWPKEELIKSKFFTEKEFEAAGL
jgi:hypothetical protein